MGNSSQISELLNGPEGSIAWAILLISFVIGVIVTWLIWRSKVNQLERQVANEKALALQHQTELSKAQEEIELKEGDLKKAGLANIKLRQDFEVISQQKEDYMTELSLVKDQVKDISNLNNQHKQNIEGLENQILGLKTKNNELTSATENKSSANTNVEVYTLKTKLTKTNSDLATAMVAIKNLEEERDALKKANESRMVAAAAAPPPASNGTTPTPTNVVRRVVVEQKAEQAVPAPAVTQKVVRRKSSPAPKKQVAKAIDVPIKKIPVKKKPVKKVEKESLRKVEGIGPKIEQLLHENGILNFKQLSKAKATKLKKILSDAGARYKMHDPTTWPEQAAMAAKGEWSKLKSYQDFLKGGVDTSKK